MMKPKVSCCIITYNHEKYIAKALESVLSQHVNFDVEVIIADDCSKDNTRKIIDSFTSPANFTIKKIYRNNNVGAAKNYIELLQAATGEYIAYLEGDDYWTDKNKLAKQVAVLDGNKNLSICYHNAKSDYINLYAAQIQSFYFNFQKSLLGKVGYSSSLMFKNEHIQNKNFETILANAPFQDWQLEIYLLGFGDGYFLSDTMLWYADNPSGSSKSLNRILVSNVIESFLNKPEILTLNVNQHFIKYIQYRLVVTKAFMYLREYQLAFYKRVFIFIKIFVQSFSYLQLSTYTQWKLNKGIMWSKLYKPSYWMFAFANDIKIKFSNKK